MKSRPMDTTAASWDQYNLVLDGMDGAARLHAAIELSESVREVRLSGIRARHPKLTQLEIVARLVWEDYGVSLPSTQ